jgi:hypothetical protein
MFRIVVVILKRQGIDRGDHDRGSAFAMAIATLRAEGKLD